MTQALATRYPLVLVPGMLGFVRLLLYPYWFGIVPALRRGGAQVFPVQVSPLHGSEVRGEQLLAIIEDICQRTGAEKVNLIGHSQGALSARYAAAKRPDRVASVTSVAGPNHGSELADHLERTAPGDSPQGASSRPCCMAWRCCWCGWRPAGAAIRCRSTCMPRISR
jgi:triacylglycerol lipase